jgi:hypothetical protein
MRRFCLHFTCLLLCVSPTLAADPNPTKDADERILKEGGFATDDPSLISFFRNRTPKTEEIKTLIKNLGDEDFDVREKATRTLIGLGSVADGYLREAAKSDDAEVRRRATECLAKIGSGPSAAVVCATARLLGKRKPAGAAEVLLDYVPKVEGEVTEEEIRTALAALAVHDGKPEPLLVKALADPLPVKRSAAAVALLIGADAEIRPQARKLLNDPEPNVRLRVALALAAQKEKDAVPVLIELLATLPAAQTPAVEDFLYRLAADKAPLRGVLADEAARKKYRDDWAAWWKAEESSIDLAKLDAATKPLGYTLMLMLDAGKVFELDADKKVRWSFTGVQRPLDAQWLPGDRVLLAEHAANKVTERNRKGEIQWEKSVQEPLVAQRLPSGRTFIATPTQLLEVDRAGKEVWSYSYPDGPGIMKAQRLANGDIALIVNPGIMRGTIEPVFLRLNPTADKELTRFAVGQRTSGGRIDVMSNGHILIPMRDDNRLVELDASGKEVWKVDHPQPISAVRLPNGHTLINSYSEFRTVEVDAAGKVVWEYKADSRINRTFRR